MAEETIKGLDRLFKKLGAVQAVSILVPPMQRAVLRIQRRMASYPPPIPNSRYVRGRGWANKDGVVTRFTSEKLGSRWTSKIESDAGGITGKVGNNASYVRYVQSRRDQAAVHQGRWETDEGALEKERPAIMNDLKRAIDGALEG